jgi:hypothetical protein
VVWYGVVWCGVVLCCVVLCCVVSVGSGWVECELVGSPFIKRHRTATHAAMCWMRIRGVGRFKMSS